MDNKLKPLLVLFAVCSVYAQQSGRSTSGSSISSPGFTARVHASYTQAEISYYPPNTVPCSVDVADMQRSITIASASGTGGVGGTVTVNTSAPHGLITGNRVYLETTVSAWNTWQTITVASPTQFTFTSSTSGSISAGNVGVEVEDLNTTLFPGANLDTRAGNTYANGKTKFNACKRDAELASDGLYHSRACQANARHHFTLSCSGVTYDSEFTTANIPVGETYNQGAPIDLSNPGSYAYPSIQWGNQAQALVDPLSGILSRRVTGPLGTASSSTPFGSALDIYDLNTGTPAWTNPQQAISGGAATFTPPCGSGTCPLFLRADGLSISGGASYAASNTGSSIDWMQPTTTISLSTGGTCTGDDCVVEACQSVNGQTCTGGIKDTVVGVTPTAVPIGGQNVMDFWQASGPPPISRPDVVEFTGTVSYVASTKTVTYTSGSYFSLNWTAGSRIVLGGPISSVTPGTGTSAGTAYVVNDVVGITQAGATLGTATVTSVNGSGGVTGATIDVAGDGYLTASGLATTGGTGSGLKINIVATGTEYPIASISNEASLILASGPASNKTAQYQASNYGVLVWKKTAGAGTVTVASSTYKIGSTAFPNWTDGGVDPSSSHSPAITADSKPGYNFFVGTELFWTAADGSETHDLGSAMTAARTNSSPAWSWIANNKCSTTTGGLFAFDPLNGDEWYCDIPIHYGSNISLAGVVQAHYMGDHVHGTPSQIIPDCALNGNTQPCIVYTNMMPTWGSTIDQAGPAFSQYFGASDYIGANCIAHALNTSACAIHLTTVDPTTSSLSFLADMLSSGGTGGGQDWPAWVFMVSLGDRTPAGTDANSFQIIAAMATYNSTPCSFCTMHNMDDVPFNGWAQISSNDMSEEDGIYGTYTMTFASGQALLNTNIGVAGGLNACPTGVPLPLPPSGNNCTTISFTGEPIRTSDGAVQNVRVGDVMQSVGGATEDMRIVQILSTSPTLQLVVQRPWGQTVAASHTATTVTMICGTIAAGGSKQTVWDYVHDPYGLNVTNGTVLNDQTLIGGHHYVSPDTTNPVFVAAGGAEYNLGAGICPSASSPNCTQARHGDVHTASSAAQIGVATGPQFDGVSGMAPGYGSQGNGVDSHPGPCFSGTCFDARPLDGGLVANDSTAGFQPFLATSTNPFVLIAGQLWKFSGANSTIHRKVLNTFAYVGRRPLVDVSGPTSSIGTTSASQYTYCYVNANGECYSSGSCGGLTCVGDVYVNAPYVQHPWCWYPGIAIQPDDVTSICIGDMGSQTAAVVQFSVPLANDLTGTSTRRLGPEFARYNQMNVFWNAVSGPSLSFFGNYARWLDGVRNDVMVATLPPLATWDGVNRATFLPVIENINPASVGISASTALIEFGYSDFGPAGNFYCTSRGETCVTVSGTVPSGANPFWFETSESGQYTPIACSVGCELAIPALSQRILYWREKYFDSMGRLVYTGPTKQEVTQ